MNALRMRRLVCSRTPLPYTFLNLVLSVLSLHTNSTVGLHKCSYAIKKKVANKCIVFGLGFSTVSPYKNTYTYTTQYDISRCGAAENVRCTCALFLSIPVLNNMERVIPITQRGIKQGGERVTPLAYMTEIAFALCRLSFTRNSFGSYEFSAHNSELKVIYGSAFVR